MAKTVDKLNEETIKFSLFLFLNSLYKTLLNVLAALVTISVGEFSFLEVVACSLFLALEISGHFWNVVGLSMSWSCKKKRKRYEKLVQMFFFARLPLIFRSYSSKALSYTSERKHGLSYFDTLSSSSYTSERTFDSFYVVCTHPF